MNFSSEIVGIAHVDGIGLRLYIPSHNASPCQRSLTHRRFVQATLGSVRVKLLITISNLTRPAHSCPRTSKHEWDRTSE